ncbi:hypothetical protein MRB53_039784 [Persea americana]|nr:hypothetical protein MRB53_039784 [Persea americana]
MISLFMEYDVQENYRRVLPKEKKATCVFNDYEYEVEAIGPEDWSLDTGPQIDAYIERLARWVFSTPEVQAGYLDGFTEDISLDCIDPYQDRCTIQ